MGLYGIGFECSMIGWEFAPGTFMIRPRTTPVMDEPSGFFGIGTLAQSLPLPTTWAVSPELSPCHPLDKPISPSFRLAAGMVTRPPRFGTSCHMRWLLFDMSIGLTMK